MTELELAKMQELVRRLNEAADAYYNGRGELMTDFEWDRMFDELKALETSTGTVLEDSPTHNVSADETAGKKEAHEFPALSLAKTKQTGELAKWAEGRPIWISWKLDGLTLVITYDGGKLKKIVTRGDGHTGTNITHLAAGIGGVPAEIAEKGHTVIRGEAVISYRDFEEFAAESQEDYANPRNLASGSLTLKDVEELKARKLVWKPFSLVYSEAGWGEKSWGAGMDALEKLGFKCVERELISNPTQERLQEAIGRWTEKVTGKICPYPVDGLVAVYDDAKYAKTGSVTGHHATREGLAFKWQDEEAKTVLDHVEWSCAVGSISPVAVFSPVELEGTTVKRANLCNISECERLGVGGKGTKISVIKANKIIPKVIRVEEKSGELEVPTKCPVCQGETAVEISEAGTKKLVCTNAACAAKALRKFMRFAGKEGMDIDGLAGETIAKFVREGWIRRASDLYRLGEHRDEIAAMEGFGEKSADKIAQAVEEAKKGRSPEKFLVALAIPQVGTEVAKLLLGAYPKLEELFRAAKEAAGTEAFTGIDGIGEQKAASFIAWCRDLENMALAEDVMAQVEFKEFKAAAKTGRCAGMVFVVTGDLKAEGRFKTRGALKAYIESEGGKVTGSVTKNTDYLINNDANSTSGKNKKAKELGIAVITEDDFCNLYA